MDDIQSIVITFLGAIGGFLVARATAGKMNAESAAISTKAFTDLADQVQALMKDNTELHRQMTDLHKQTAELKAIIAEKEHRIAELEQEVEALRSKRGRARNG